MSTAPDYTPGTSFADDEANNVAGRSLVKTTSLDTELANVSTSINDLNANLQAMQRDDRKLKDGIIEPYALSEQTNALIATGGTNPRGTWGTQTDYKFKDLIQRNNIAQICLQPHNSGSVFVQSLWLPISGDGTSAANAAAAAASASDALTSETNAAASAAIASAADAAANTSATTASTAAINAGNSASSASTSETNAASSAISAMTAAAEVAAGIYLVTSPTGYIGYGPGSGGSVTQTVSKSTAVTLNRPTGRITMHNAALAAGSSVTFLLNNSLLGPNDTVLAVVSGGSSTPDSYGIRARMGGGGAAAIIVVNSSGAPLSEALIMNFTIIKGANS